MLDAAELTQIQADAVAAACSLSCQIQRKTLTRDTIGQGTENWATIATVNVGMNQPSQQLLQNYDYLIGSLSAWLVKFPVGTNVQAQDHLVIGSQTLVVHVLLSPRSYPALLTVLAAEIQ